MKKIQQFDLAIFTKKFGFDVSILDLAFNLLASTLLH